MTNGCPQGGIRLLLEHFELRDQKEKDSAKETAGSIKRNCRKHRRKRREAKKETAESTEGNGGKYKKKLQRAQKETAESREGNKKEK